MLKITPKKISDNKIALITYFIKITISLSLLSKLY